MSKGARSRHRIQARVSTLVAVGMLGPLAAVVFIGSGSQQELERRILAGRTLNASFMAERLQTLLSSELETLRAVAQSARSDPARAGPALREAWVQRHEIFDAVFAVDRAGRVLAQEPAPDPAVDGPRAAAEADRTARPAFTDLLTSGPGALHVYALVPIRGGDGKLAGAIGGIIDPGSTRFASILKGYRSVSGESIDLVDSAGAVLASSDPARVLLSSAGADELVARARISVARWEVAVRQSRSEALGFDLSRRVFGASALALAIALAFAWGASRSLTRPLSALTAAAERISLGQLAQPIPLLDDDEVGLLGRALERMRAALQDSIALLESRVEERTADLARVNQELQAHEDAVRRLLGKIIGAQEDERRRVARELHDETTQSLTTLAMRIQTAAAAAPPGELRDHLEAACVLAERTLDGVHRLIVDLRPAVLDDLGLKSAILWYAEKHLEPRGIAVRCEFSDLDGRLPAQLETAVFRVVQEALTNVARHAQASRVLVQAARRHGRLTLEIEDDGKGFDHAARAAARPDGSGWGLLGMRERVEILGGELRIDSAPGEGTHLALWVPLPESAPIEEAAHG